MCKVSSHLYSPYGNREQGTLSIINFLAENNTHKTYVSHFKTEHKRVNQFNGHRQSWYLENFAVGWLNSYRYKQFKNYMKTALVQLLLHLGYTVFNCLMSRHSKELHQSRESNTLLKCFYLKTPLRSRSPQQQKNI